METKKPGFKIPALNTAKLAQAQEKERLEAEPEASNSTTVPNSEQKGMALAGYLTHRGDDDPYKMRGLPDKPDKLE
jgi:hypothetical protein